MGNRNKHESGEASLGRYQFVVDVDTLAVILCENRLFRKCPRLVGMFAPRVRAFGIVAQLASETKIVTKKEGGSPKR